MADLLKVASLGLCAAIGIASAVSVATQFQPATSALTLSSVDLSDGIPATVGAGPADAASHAEKSPQPPAGPAVTSPAAPTLDPSDSQRSAATADVRHDDQMGEPLSPAQPLNSFAASYQPMVTAQFDLMRDAIGRITETQEQTARLVSKLQDGQNQRPTRAEDIPLPSPAASSAVGPSVTMNNDKLTLIFQDSDIKAVLNAIGTEAGLNILTSESVSGLVSATLTDVEIETALNAVLRSRGLVSRREGNIVYVGTHQELHFVQHGGDIIATRVYRPNYVAALDLQGLITPLISKGAGQITVSAASEVGIASDSASAGGNSFTGEEVVIVRDFEGVLAQIDQLVAEVDRMPRQVAIEAMILSVTLDDKNEMGVDFELLRQQDTLRITSGTPLVDLTTAPFKDGLKIGFLDTSIFLFLNALETIGDTNVVASPRVMCLNKQRAEILIGSQLGYVSTTITETAATQAVQFLEVGTQLSIRPFISSEGMIRMEVHPELSTGSVRVESGFTLPDKEVTQVTTNVMCPDGATVVIGGLIREDLVTTSSQIPVLGNLPWVGPAFRQRKEEIARREIIVLLTPRIIQEADLWDEGQAYAHQVKDRRGVFLDKMNPLGGPHIAERYARKATAAWAAGDADMALRYCNLAIQFDPLHRGAVALRTEVLSVAPGLETSVHEHLRHGLDPGHRPHRDYSKQGYPWRALELGPAAGNSVPQEIELLPIEIGPPPWDEETRNRETGH